MMRPWPSLRLKSKRHQLVTRWPGSMTNGARLSCLFVALASLFLPVTGCASCIPFSEAFRHVGKTACVFGRVFSISQGPNGSQYVDFCADHERCSFSAVVAADDLRDVGDIRGLPGKTVELHGRIRESDGQAQITLTDARQLKGPGAKLPPVPKTYDVEERGHARAGTSKPPQKAKKSRRAKPKLPAGGIEVPSDEEQ